AFRFTSTGVGSTIIDCYPVAPSGLDARLDIYDSAGVLLATADPSAFNDQHVTLDLAAGNYYAFVSSHGDYGDLGTYQLSVRQLAKQWAHADVGSVGIGGMAGYNPTDGVYTVAGGG